MGGSERAETVLRRMETLCEAGNKDVQPDTIAFNKVILSWANSGTKQAAARAEGILRDMESLYESGKNLAAKPDGFSYKTVLMAWSQDDSEGALEKAQFYLDLMESNYFEGDKRMKPDLLCYKVVVNGWKSRGEVGKVSYLMNRLEKIYQKKT